MTDTPSLELRLETLIGSLKAQLAPDTLFATLRRLQEAGLTRGELQVHLERARASNEASGDAAEVEETALLALDMVSGQAGPAYSLRWDRAEMARIILSRVIDAETVRASIVYAVEPSDLLPPRPSDRADELLSRRFAALYVNQLSAQQLSPVPALFVQVPKSPFTSRPAALLQLKDRITYEALGTRAEEAISSGLGPEVLWPRTRQTGVRHREDDDASPLMWRSRYVVKADIVTFYESVDHGELAAVLQRQFGIDSNLTTAVRDFLGAVMGHTRGLPQGPLTSDLFGTAYLAPIDRWAKSIDLPFLRYADDYFFPASTLDEGRGILRRLSNEALRLGLSLSTHKTQIMRSATYARGLHPSDSMRALQRELTDERVDALLSEEDEDVIAETLTTAGVDEQVLWDLFYHRTTTLDDVIQEVRTRLRPSLTEAYSEFLQRLSVRLRHAQPPADLVTAERLARRCLVYVAAAEADVSPADLRVLLDWFPRLAPNVSSYLQEVVEESPGLVEDFFLQWVRTTQKGDWATAWICHVAEARPSLVQGQVLRALRRIVRDGRRGFLTRSASLRALASSGKLRQEEWHDVLDSSPPAGQAELVLGAWSNLDSYPFLMRSGKEWQGLRNRFSLPAREA